MSIPIYEPNARWSTWSIAEVYTGPNGSGRYVPKLKDWVVDPDTGEYWRVIAVDESTLLTELLPLQLPNSNYVLSQPDVLFGVGPGFPSETYRLYLDTSVTPYTLAVDTGCVITGSMTSYVKIFKGSDLGGMGQVISQRYNSSGQFISNNIPLELAAMSNYQNYAVKVVEACNTMTELQDGEIATVVGYTQDGIVTYKRGLIVENTAFIRSISAPQVYITAISLESPFLSPTVENLIEFPLNVPISALNLIGVVWYSDGTQQRRPVDGTKFRMFGLDQYISSIVGQRFDLVLSYVLSSDEATNIAVSGEGKYITKPYSVLTVNPNNSYAVKLFGYPVWGGDLVGYTIQWFMMNLDRNLWFDVTPYVRFSETTGAYNPLQYGYLQHKAVSINLHDVSGSFKNFIHTQVFDVVLNGPPTVNQTPWTVKHSVTPSTEYYGTGLYAERVVGNQQSISIVSGYTTKSDWLQNVYYKTYPLMDPFTEVAVPVPTHVIVSYNGLAVEVPIDNWNLPVNFGTNIPIPTTVFLRFILRTNDGDANLAMAALVVLSEA